MLRRALVEAGEETHWLPFIQRAIGARAAAYINSERTGSSLPSDCQHRINS